MKKYLWALIVLLSFFFVGCDPATYHFDADALIADTVKIELAECENDDPEEFFIDEDHIPSFDYGNAKIIDSLDPGQFESFIVGLAAITFHIEEDYSANMPIGRTLILHQSNGDMIVLSCNGFDGEYYSFASLFDSNSHFIAHIANFADAPSFDELLNAYFPS